MEDRRRRDLWELAVGYGLILLVLWTPPPFQRSFYLVAAGFLLAASLRPGETRRGLGHSSQDLLASSWGPLVGEGVDGGSVLVAKRLGTLHAPGTARQFVVRFWGYALWSMAQQFLLIDFFLLRFRRLLPGRPAVATLAAAGIFAAAHLPSPALTVFTFVWGWVACAVFLRFRNLLPLGVAHAILGIAVAVCLPGTTTHNMHVGLGYFHYRHRPAQRRVSDHTVSTSVCVRAEAAILRFRRQARP